MNLLRSGSVLLILLIGCQSRNEREPDLLENILGSWRPTLFRLDPHWAHNHWLPDTNANSRRERRVDLALLEQELRNSRESFPAGVWLDLIWNKPRAARDKLSALEAEQGNSALFHHAQAAAAMMLAREPGMRVELVYALASVDQAIAAQKDLAAACFNRALILEQLFLYRQAVRAWDRFLELDNQSGWAAEARQRRQALTTLTQPGTGTQDLPPDIEVSDLQEIARRDAGLVLEHVNRIILLDWAREQLAGNEQQAAALLERANQSMILLQEPYKRLLEFMIRDIRQAVEPEKIYTLARAHQALESGRSALEKRSLGEAEKQLKKAQQLFIKINGHGRFLTAYYLAVSAYHHQAYDHAGDMLATLSESVDEGLYPGLQGRVLWMQGLIAQILEDPLLAGERLAKAGELFARYNETGHLAGIENLLSSVRSFLGDERGGWEHVLTAFEAGFRSGDPKRLHLIAVEAIYTLRNIGHPETALYYLEIAGEMAQLTGDAGREINTHLLAARIHGDLGNRQEALKAVGAARALLDDVPRNKPLSALADLSEARAYLEQHPQRALELLASAREAMLDLQWRNHLGELYGYRAQAQLAANRPQAAEEALLEGIELAESQWEQVKGRKQKQSLAMENRPLYDALIRYRVDAGRSQQALEIAERMHMTRAPGPGESKAALGQNTTLIQYVMLHDRICIWVMNGDRLHYYQTNQTRETMKESIDGLLKSIGHDSAERESAAALFDALIRPALPVIPADHSLMIVPDRKLFDLPFGLLFDRETGRRLIGDHAYMIMPAASHIPGAVARYRQRSARKTGVLLVGNPAFDRNVFPQLRDLPGALAEARALAKLYPESHLLEGVEAGKENFLKKAGNYGVIHFGGHALSGGTRNDYAYLVMAPNLQSNGALYTREIARARFQQTHLVVLAACSTARGLISDRYGPANPVSAFLKAGVPTVVANLWDIDDGRTGDFLNTFHKNLIWGQHPASALRNAQLQALSTGLSPRIWAGFQVYGGSL